MQKKEVRLIVSAKTKKELDKALGAIRHALGYIEMGYGVEIDSSDKEVT